jgi:tRNA (guanine-N7-)-methyltransferase
LASIVTLSIHIRHNMADSNPKKRVNPAPWLSKSAEPLPARQENADLGAEKADRYGFVGAQQEPHEQLVHRVTRHLGAAFKKPPAAHNRLAFETLLQWQNALGVPLVLDAGCGTAVSTLALARQHPDCLVVGIDRSADRLRRGPLEDGKLRDRCGALRADMVDIWLLMRQHDVVAVKTYLLYPNPYPKRTQLHLRWHGHAVFPTLVDVALGRSGCELELRTNWQVYRDELVCAVQVVAKQRGFELELAQEPLSQQQKPLSNFEKKYREAGSEIHELRIVRVQTGRC